MKKTVTALLCILLVLAMVGCANPSDNKSDPGVKETVKGNMETYCEMTDGTWTCNGYTYAYRLEISGRLNNAAEDSTFVYLSNLKEITFEQAYKASGLSSDTNDYFKPEDAVLVEMD